MASRYEISRICRLLITVEYNVFLLCKTFLAFYLHYFARQYDQTIAYQYLREGRIAFRTFGDVLKVVYPAPDLFDRLVKFYSEEGNEPNLASTQRKIICMFQDVIQTAKNEENLSKNTDNND